MKQLIALLAIPILLTGCASVPATHVEIPTAHGKFILDSPKENDWRGVEFEFDPTTGHVKAKIQRVSSGNSADVIAAVANSNAQMADRVGALAEKAIQAAEKGAVKAVVPAP